MGLYTKTGDEGDTGLLGNRRVPKDSARIEAYGTIDELNSVVGLLRCESLPTETDRHLQEIQELLFDVGADLATEGGSASVPALTAAIARVEQWIDASEGELAPLRTFVLPGGTRSAALLHLARTVCRRAERRYWSLVRIAPDTPRAIGIYLNRLSDLCFTWARRDNRRAGKPDVPWRRADARGE